MAEVAVQRFPFRPRQPYRVKEYRDVVQGEVQLCFILLRCSGSRQDSHQVRIVLGRETKRISPNKPQC